MSRIAPGTIQPSGLSIDESQAICSLFTLFVNGQGQKFMEILDDSEVLSDLPELRVELIELAAQVGFDMKKYDDALFLLTRKEDKVYTSVYNIFKTMKEHYHGEKTWEEIEAEES